MKKHTTLFLICLTLATCQTPLLQAQSAVALCTGTTKYSITMGALTESEAREAARQKCQQDCNGSVSIITSTSSPGYGCIYSGVNKDGQMFIAASLGNSSSYGAAEKARDALPFGMVDFKKEYEFYDKGGVAREVAPVETASQWTSDELRAFEFQQKNDYSTALSYAKRALDNRYTTELNMLYGYCLLMLEKHQEAWSVFDNEIRVRNSSNPLAFHYRGNMAAKLEKWDLALQDYNTVLTKGSKDIQIYSSKGFVQFNLNDYDGAIQSYSQYLQTVQTDFGAYHIRALAYAAKNEHELAKSDFTKAIDLGGKIPQTFFGRGKILLNQGKFADAINDFTKTTELAPGDAAAWYFLGYALAAGEKLQAAVDAFSTCIKLNQDIPDAWMYRGYLKWMLKDKENAETDFNKAIQLNPELKETISKMKGS